MDKGIKNYETILKIIHQVYHFLHLTNIVGLHVPSTNPSMPPDLLNAHSLLSTNAWSLNDGESTSMEGLVQANYNQVMRHSDNSESHHLSLFHQGPPVSLIHSVNLQDEASSHHQEYRLFKSPYDSDHGFFSNQRYL